MLKSILFALTGLLALPIAVFPQDNKWVDPAIMKQLQAIQSIDRTKLAPAIVQSLADQISERVVDAVVEPLPSSESLSGLNIPPQQTIKVTGKSKSPMNINGRSYPPGLSIEIVYGADGTPIKGQVEIPKALEPTYTTRPR